MGVINERWPPYQAGGTTTTTQASATTNPPTAGGSGGAVAGTPGEPWTLINEGSCTRTIVNPVDSNPTIILPPQATKTYTPSGQVGNTLIAHYGDAQIPHEQFEWSITGSIFFDASYISGFGGGYEAKQHGTGATRGFKDIMPAINQKWAQSPPQGVDKNNQNQFSLTPDGNIQIVNTPAMSDALADWLRAGWGDYFYVGAGADGAHNCPGNAGDNANTHGGTADPTSAWTITWSSACPDFSRGEPNPAQGTVPICKRSLGRSLKHESRGLPILSSTPAVNETLEAEYPTIGQGQPGAASVPAGIYAMGGMILLLFVFICSLLRDNNRRLRSVVNLTAAAQSQLPIIDAKPAI